MLGLSHRQEQILNIVVEKYIKNAEPIGSKLIQQEYDFPISSATIRNEMVELCEMGFFDQPHTSSGRIPTAIAFRYYIDHMLESVEPDVDFFKELACVSNHYEQHLKRVAKALSHEIASGVFIGFPGSSIYYTGLAHLFSQPEFTSSHHVKNMGVAIDHIDEMLEELIQRFGATGNVTVLLGDENPLGSDCGTVMIKYHIENDRDAVLGVFGPMRIDYGRALALLKGLCETLK